MSIQTMAAPNLGV